MKTTIIFFVGACLIGLLASCGGSGNEVGQGGTSQAGSGGSGGTGQAGQAGSGGTNQAGQGGAGQGGEGGEGGEGGDPEPRNFTVTIENDTSGPLFVDGLFLPFTLSTSGHSVSLFSECNCDQCNTGQHCLHGDPRPIAIEIPNNDSLEVETELLRYVSQGVTEATCPEAIQWNPRCSVAHELDPGTYQIRVRYDTLAAIQAQGMAPTSQTKWGHTVWMETSPGIGVVELNMSMENSILLDDSSPVQHTMSISSM